MTELMNLNLYILLVRLGQTKLINVAIKSWVWPGNKANYLDVPLPPFGWLMGFWYHMQYPSCLTPVER